MKTLLDRMNSLESPWCQRWNRRGDLLETQRFFATVSRLGDGIIWYLLMFLLAAIHGTEGLLAAMQMLLVGVASLLIYKLLKTITARDRPCDFDQAIHKLSPALDRYSFPSGHTMHAVGFSIVVIGHFPQLAALLVPFSLLVAASRLILGLHYPSDVLIGALIGAGVASASFQLTL